MVHFWKGKQKATTEQVERWRRDDEDEEGAIIELQYVGTGANDQTYTVPLKFGSAEQTVSLQVDTGSSDIWIASSLCSSCNSDAKKYDPNSSQTSQSSNVAFNIDYLRGKVTGTIYWDTVSVGNYSVDNQAFAAATDVQDEPLSGSFNGVFGLALPGNSIIYNLIPGGTAVNGRDGALITSNLFSISPSSSAPAARFISLTLSRPGSDTIPSLMGIGRHPPKSAIPSIGDGTQVAYSAPIASTNDKGPIGTIFWKTSVKDITVWVNNQPRVVKLSRSGIGGTGGAGPFPTAVLDTGIPLIYSTKVIADAIYGAIGISPASDGFYYMDCKTPLNLTITLDDRPPISLHPLDLTVEPPRDATSVNCIGLIQAADGAIQSANAADMILGVPFLRNVYMVMAYQIPNSNGTFPDIRPPDNAGPTPFISESRLRLGLQGLTDPSVAMNEFNRVRVQGLPIDDDGNRFIGNSENKKKISVGLEILFGLVGFVILCVGLFGLRWCLYRRKYKAANAVDTRRELGAAADAGATAISGSSLFRWWKKQKSPDDNEKKMGTYELAAGRWSEDEFVHHEDVLRRRKFDEYMRRERLKSEYTVSSSYTHVDVEEDPTSKDKKDPDVEMLDTLSERDSVGHSVDPHNDINREWDPAKELDWSQNRDTLVGRDFDKDSSPERTPLSSRRLSNNSVTSPLPVHSRSIKTRHHRDSSGAPLLPLGFDGVSGSHSRSPTLVTDPDMNEFGVLSLSMAGIGTAARNSRIDAEFRLSTADTDTSPSHRRDASSTSRTDARSLSSDSRIVPLADEFANLQRPVSISSTHSSRKERPARSPTGPRPNR
ncbi:hypothetical protein E1B28_007331 [Marasmius oreades]|uniref:Peptidase A1 domain-containing protein n=1 Tax=Marasmius oreades TaxID=181124 RepID=A0A9P7S1L9_9AGAR|nr:uncharacterized protein E1B28_007331 [Marasmius oreades]KAG7093672.1 hypothetical protein E1B28_007331 [Marasmius oreades]